MRTLDDIYEAFIWDKSYTKEEYEAKIAVGINEARKYKYLYPFIQPVIPEVRKCIWEPCAMVIAMKTDEELKPYLPLLFEWLQDINWPGAQTIFDRLSQMPVSMLEEDYSFSRRRAERENDNLWLLALDDFAKQLD